MALKCGGKPFVGVCHSNAGYYWGSKCSGCGQPFSRETGYYPTSESCRSAHDKGELSWRDTKYRPTGKKDGQQ
jgi:hypothetical protein